MPFLAPESARINRRKACSWKYLVSIPELAARLRRSLVFVSAILSPLSLTFYHFNILNEYVATDS